MVTPGFSRKSTDSSSSKKTSTKRSSNSPTLSNHLGMPKSSSSEHNDEADIQLFKQDDECNPSKRHIVMVIVVVLLIFTFVIVTLIIGWLLSYSESTKMCFPERDSVLWDNHDEQGHFFKTQTTYLRARHELHRKFNMSFPDPGPSCKPVYFYMINRHTVKYPEASRLDKHRKALPKLQKDILAAGKLDEMVGNELKYWKLLMHSPKGKEITTSGKFETEAIASIFYKYFPTLLSLNKTQFEVTVSSTLRTKETAEAFIQGLAKIQEYSELSRDELWKKFHFVTDDSVAFPKKNSYVSRGPSLIEMGRSVAGQAMLSQFNVRYGLKGKNQANFKGLFIMYDVCGYELAIQQSSPWCNLFTYGELQLIQYLRDTKAFFTYQPLQNYIGPIVMGDLYRHLNEQILLNPRPNRTSATLTFSHSEVLAPLVSYLNIYPAMVNTSSIPACLDLNRKWHSGNAIQFNANFAVILYQCDEDGQQNFKLMPLWNEVPVKIKGCEKKICDFEEFKKLYEHVKPVKPE